MQNERISLLLILVDPESTVCPEKGVVSRTSCSKSTTCPEEGGVLRTRLHITIQDKRNNHSHEIIDCGYQPHDMGTRKNP